MTGSEGPRVVCFSCSFGWGYQRNRDASPELPYRLEVPCSGSIEAEQVLEAFHRGADEVLILACPDGECHFQDGNHQCRKRVELLRKLLAQHGIDSARLRMEFGRDARGEGIAARMAGTAEREEP